MTSTLDIEAQKPDLDAMVDLFEIDASTLGGPVYYFTGSAFAVTMISFDGHVYTPIDFEAEGFELTGQGAAPTPRIRIANTTRLLSGVVIEYEDLLGATVSRRRTFARFLDGQVDADPTQCWVDIYRIERKTTQNKLFLEFELSSVLDQEGKMLPGRQMLRDTCTYVYRRYDPTNPSAAGDGFVYATYEACPYTGASYFDAMGVVCSAANDKCSKRLTSGCKARYGTASLPFRGFPNLARIRS